MSSWRTSNCMAYVCILSSSDAIFQVSLIGLSNINYLSFSCVCWYCDIGILSHTCSYKSAECRHFQGCCWRYLSCWRLLPKCTYIYIYLIFPLLKSFPKSMQPSGCRVCKKPVPWPEISNQNIEVPHTWEQGPCWEETYWIYLTQSMLYASVCMKIVGIFVMRLGNPWEAAMLNSWGGLMKSWSCLQGKSWYLLTVPMVIQNSKFSAHMKWNNMKGILYIYNVYISLNRIVNMYTM